ncbi:MAG: hypothetical protein K8F91_10785 [Candidatus Obscuribacterales bacterium]|nr:hypothetical protein [Candidatus Obscuribacterales bacterium]
MNCLSLKQISKILLSITCCCLLSGCAAGRLVFDSINQAKPDVEHPLSYKCDSFSFSYPGNWVIDRQTHMKGNIFDDLVRIKTGKGVVTSSIDLTCYNSPYNKKVAQDLIGQVSKPFTKEIQTVEDATWSGLSGVGKESVFEQSGADVGIDSKVRLSYRFFFSPAGGDTQTLVVHFGGLQSDVKRNRSGFDLVEKTFKLAEKTSKRSEVVTEDQR